MTDLSTSLTSELVDQIVTRNELAAASSTLEGRYRRRPKRKAGEKGLGTDEQLADLARAYLQTVSQHFPKAVETGVVDLNTQETLASMVADLKRRHKGDPIDEGLLKGIASRLGLVDLAAAYGRYSSDNSNPRSIADQIVNCVRKAAEKGTFIPWCAVFVDYAISGMTTNRPGYTAFRALLSEQAIIRTAFVDDFSRASRDMMEWWSIAAFAKRYDKSVVGASDSLDTSGMMADVVVMVQGMVSKLFIEGLRQKVGRGMTSAAKRELCLGKPPFGFTRRKLPDGKGGFLCDTHGDPVYEWAPEPESQKYVVLMFRLFVIERWSCNRIAKHFNELKVDDWEGWTTQGIRTLLKNPAVIGCFIWNRSRTFFDPAEERWVKIRKPRKDWIVRYRPEKALVPVAWYAAARKVIAESRRNNPTTGRKYGKSYARPETLVTGYWYCDCCDTLLKLVRSCGRYQQLGNSSSGVDRRKCKLKSSKSVRVIESCFLKALNERLLSEQVINSLIQRANEELHRLDQEPQASLEPKKRTLASRRRKARNVMATIAETEDKEIRQQLTAELARINSEIRPLASEVAALTDAAQSTLAKLDATAVREGLQRIAEVLQGERPRAVAALKRLVGAVRVREEHVEGTKRKRWIAVFTPKLGDLVSALRAAEVPPTRLNITLEPVEVVIDQPPSYERNAIAFKRMIDEGQSISTVATVNQVSFESAKAAVAFARTGERPKFNNQPKRSVTKKREGTKFKDHSAEVARLREQEHMSMKAIAKKLVIGLATATRAYDYARPEAVAAAVANKRRVTRGHVPRLSKAKVDRMKQLVQTERTATSIAAEIGCGINTVLRCRRKTSATT